MADGINFSGLASGLDTASIVDALVNVARNPIRRLESQRSTYNSKISLISTLSSRLAAFRSAAETLDSTREFKTYKAESSNTDAMTVTADSYATPGTYQINITNLAEAERTYSDVVSAKDDPAVVGHGKLYIQVAATSPAVGPT